MVNMFVTKGDITRTVTVDAIVTLLNPDGMWSGAIDYAIQRVAGRMYHAQVLGILNRLGLNNGQVVIAIGNRAGHNGSFNDVIFVVDALKSPLNELVYAALQKATLAGYSSIALPLMRTGVMLGIVEPDVKTVVEQMQIGINRFQQNSNVNMDIYIVVYSDSEAIEMFNSQLV